LTLKTETVGLRGEVQSRLRLDPTKDVAKIVQFIQTQSRSSECKGVVVGLSGGIDSAVTAALCNKALGPKKVTGVFLFERKNRDGVDAQHAEALASQLGIRTLDFVIDPVVKCFSVTFPLINIDRVTSGNMKGILLMV